VKSASGLLSASRRRGPVCRYERDSSTARLTQFRSE
jgi:hypothetical protein